MDKQLWFKQAGRWIALGAGVILLFALGFWVARSGLLDPIIGKSAALTPAVSAQASEQTTVPVRAASTVEEVSAAGNLALAKKQAVVFEVNGLVSELYVQVGDEVEAGDLLVRLDSQEAERAVEQALLSVSTAQANYNDKLDGGGLAEVEAAEASLRAAQANLEDVMAGPNDEEIASAQAALAAAQASYADLTAGPSQAELTQLATAMRKAQVAVAEAQTNYDKIAWQNNAGMTGEAAALQSATLDYEDALAAYEEATAPATAGNVQTALSNMQSAQETLANLLDQPTVTQIASAESQVASAESTLKQLQAGGDSSAIQTARANLAQAQLDLDNAVADLANTEIRSPMAGTVLSLDLAHGQQVMAGTTAANIADVTDLELNVNVAEVDIEQVQVGQPVAITVDALPGQSFAGTVSQVAPASDPESGVVNYPVTIQLTDQNLGGVRAGMTALATLQNQAAASGWLVPRTSVQTTNNNSQVAIVRNGATLNVPVTTGMIQGEWIVVESPEIQAGDQVIGTVTLKSTSTAESSESGGILDGVGP